MLIWILTIVFGLCTFFSLYMAFLGFRLGEGSAFVFVAFGLLFGIPFVLSAIKAVARKADEKISGEPKPVRFVPHWFMMAAIIGAGVIILASVLIPLFF